MSRAVLSVLGTLAYVAAWRWSGNAHDIERNYSLHDVNVSASMWDPFALEWRRKLNRRRTEAMAQCKQQGYGAGVTTTGE